MLTGKCRIKILSVSMLVHLFDLFEPLGLQTRVLLHRLSQSLRQTRRETILHQATEQVLTKQTVIRVERFKRLVGIVLHCLKHRVFAWAENVVPLFLIFKETVLGCTQAIHKSCLLVCVESHCQIALMLSLKC